MVVVLGVILQIDGLLVEVVLKLESLSGYLRKGCRVTKLGGVVGLGER